MVGEVIHGSELWPRRMGEWVESASLSRLTAWVARHHGLTREDAEDLLQEVRLSLLLRRPDLEVNVTFALHTATHKAVDMVRGKVREKRLSRRDCGLCGDAELVHLLNARVSCLPKRLQIFCMLRYELGLNGREIAALLGVGRASVRWLESKSERALGVSA